MRSRLRKFKARVIASVPTLYEADVEVIAKNRKEAEAKIRDLYAKDELEMVEFTTDYDSAEIIELQWKEGGE
jgi:hypothetical protein